MQSKLPLLLDGFRKTPTLVDVNIGIDGCAYGEVLGSAKPIHASAESL
jgi:hypothetical protein